MGDLNALRLTGRPGCKNNVGQLLGVNRGPISGSCPTAKRRIKIERLGIRLRQFFSGGIVRQDERQFALFSHCSNPLARVVRVDRYVGTTGTHNSQQRGNQVRRPLHTDPDTLLPRQPLSKQFGSDFVAAVHQFDISQGAFY